MERFTPSELQAIDGVDELRISSLRINGTMRPFVIVWSVRDGDDIYVRSAYGPSSGWFRRAMASGHGEIRSGGIVRRVAFERTIDDATHERLDAAYHRKYDRYGARMVGTVVGPHVREVTLRLRPE